MFRRGSLFLLIGLVARTAKSQELKLPLEFEANRGQFAAEVLFLARTPNHFVYLTREGMTLGLSGDAQRGGALRMRLLDADPSAAVAPESRLPGISNYFIGKDPSRWHRDVPHYGRVRYRSVWPGIDLVFHGRDQSLEYDFVVSAGANPSAIRLRYANMGSLRIDATGSLVIETPSGKVVQKLPEIYQESAGIRKAVGGAFRITDDQEVRFEVGNYDRSLALVIDPTITYSNYIGGSGTLTVSATAVDSAGNSYITGFASSSDFPLVTPLQQFPGSAGLFVSSTQGNTWSAPSSSIGTASVLSLAADPVAAGTAYAGTSRGVFKTTNSGGNWAAASSGLPKDSVTSVAVDPLSPATLYACMLEGLFKSTDGAATWKLLPNAGGCVAVAVDPKTEGTLWLAYSFYYPVVSFDGGNSFFEGNYPQISATSVVIDPNNSKNVFYGTVDGGLLISTNAGVSFTPNTLGLAGTNNAGVTVNAVAIAKTSSARILVGTPTGAYLSVNSGNSFQATTGIGNREVLSVLFDPHTDGIALAGTAGGGVYVSSDGGQTWTSSGPANLNVNALAMSIDEQSTWAGLYTGMNAFVTKINAAGTSVVYSSYLGGTGVTSGAAIAVDSAGHAFVCGQTDASDFPTQSAYQRTFGGGTDFFISRLDAAGSALDASTFLGGHANDSCNGLALDPSGNAYVTGSTSPLGLQANSDFPATTGAVGQQGFGGEDCVVAKFDNGLQHLIYSTFLGGNLADNCYSVAADVSGNAYVAGVTFSSNFLTTQPPFGGTKAVGSTTTTPAFVAEINPTGSALVYSGLLGGTKGLTQITSIVVGPTGRAYVTGFTEASDYPFTSNALNTTVLGIRKTVVTAIEANGTKLVYSTLLPSSGSDVGTAIALDSNNNAWVTGEDFSGVFPVTSDALPHKPSSNSVSTPFAAALDSTGSTMLHATYLGGSAGGIPGGIAVGADGSVYLSGTTLSTDFTVTGTPFQKSQATDYIAYLTRLVFSGGGGGIPAITAVQNGASFQNGFATGAWMTIKGANLSTVTDTWANSIVNGQLPTTLDGVSVSVGGQLAYIYFISPGQINVVVPNIQPGQVNVTITNSGGTSAPFSATALTYQPAFFLATGGYAVATHLDYSLALKNGAIPGVTTVPAQPGETIILWGAGFGPTNPAAPPGVEVPASAFPTASPVTVTVGNQPATVYGAALAPGLAALYQVAIQIPASLANGDYPVVATVGGLLSPVTTLITVQH
jgi:uncharacterized protein (TIGR03437 family)